MPQNLSVTEVFEDLLYDAFELPFNDVAHIRDIEQKIYQNLEQHPSDICGIIALTFVNIMQGKRDKALSYIKNIWKMGGELPSFFELIYIECLLCLGELEMASIMLKSRFENLAHNIREFYSVLSKFSIITGNLNLIFRMSSYPELKDDDDLLLKLANTYNEQNNSNDFKNIQKLIIEQAKYYLCAYEYEIIEDIDEYKLEIQLYVALNEENCLRLQQMIQNKINGYWLSVSQKSPLKTAIVVRNICEHESWLPPEA